MDQLAGLIADSFRGGGRRCTPNELGYVRGTEGGIGTHSASPSENQNNSLPFSIPGSMVVIRLTPTYSYAWWASTSSDLV